MYPLTAYDTSGKIPVPVTTSLTSDSRALSPERNSNETTTTESSSASSSMHSHDKETRKVINMMCNVKPKDNNGETEFVVSGVLERKHAYLEKSPFW